MASVPEFERKVRRFADETQEFLNQTVCEYARVGASILNRNQLAAVAGTSISDGNVKSQPVPLLTTARNSLLWLDVSYRLTLDGDEGEFLAVQSSFFGISVGEPDEQDEVVHYDFERGKEPYPEAHVQVYGEHPAFLQYAREVGAKDQLGRYHLPVGGRRMRPCLEDVIEFLITERLVEHHGDEEDWKRVLNDRRKKYRKTQIEALVRRNQGTAIEELRRLGYTIFHPKDPRKRAKVARLFSGTTTEIGPVKGGKK